jgi:hypothetical protein
VQAEQPGCRPATGQKATAFSPSSGPSHSSPDDVPVDREHPQRLVAHVAVLGVLDRHQRLVEAERCDAGVVLARVEHDGVGVGRCTQIVEPSSSEQPTTTTRCPISSPAG